MTDLQKVRRTAGGWTGADWIGGTWTGCRVPAQVRTAGGRQGEIIKKRTLLSAACALVSVVTL